MSDPKREIHSDEGLFAGRRSTIFALSASASFLLYLHRYTWNLVRPELQAEYNLSNSQLETLGSAFFLPYAAGQIPGGILCDLFGPHLFLVAIILIWSILLPLHGLSGNYWSLLGVRAGFGLSQAACYPALSKVTRSWFPLRGRTQIQGWIASAFGRGGGAMASIVMGVLLMDTLGLSWRNALVVLSIVGMLFAAAFFFLFSNAPEASSPKARKSKTGDPAPQSSVLESNKKVLPFSVALKNRSYVVLLFQQFLNAGSDVVFALILGSYFKSLGVENNATLGLLVSLPLWGGAIGGIFGGYANDWAIARFSNRRICRSAVAGIGLGLGGLIVLLAVASPQPTYVAIGLLLARFFCDWNQPTVWGTCTDLGGRYSATVFGMNNMVGNLGAFLTPFAVGILLDYFSTFSAVDGKQVRDTNFVPAFVLCGGMMLAASFCWIFIDCTNTIVTEADES